MKIALFHPWIWLKGGAEKVCLELIKKSKHDIHIYTLHWDKQQTFPEFQEFEDKIHVLEPNFKMDSFARKGLRAGLKLAFKKVDFSAYDGVIVSSGGIGELIAIQNHDVPVGIYSHTPLRIIHDKPVKKDNFQRLPIHMKILYHFLSEGYAILEKMAWKKFSLVMTNSQNTRQRIIDAGLAEDPVVVYPGVATGSFTYNPNPRKNYFFVPGRITYHKRQHLAIEAFRQFQKKYPDWCLILAGNTRAENKDYINSIYQKAGHGVVIRENVTTQEMIELYQQAHGTLFTPMNEDFGITPVESMSCGTPVIAVNEGGVKETVIDGKTGFLVHASPYSIAEKMVLSVERDGEWDSMKNKAWIRSQFFDWQNFVDAFDWRVETWLLRERAE